MIGLERNTVKVVPYQETWPAYFQKVANELQSLLKDKILQIEHIGSTAVKGLPAKPIIDIAVAISDGDQLPEVSRLLSQENYEDRGARLGGYLFVKRSDGLTTHHIHLVLESDQRWKDYIAFRDQLNASPELRNQYSSLKQNLAAKYPNDRGKYTAAKHDFISKILGSIPKKSKSL